MNSRFFKARRGLAILFGTLFAVFAFVLSVGLPAWLSVGTGNPASRTVNALTDNKEVRDEAARFFVEKLTESDPTKDLARFDQLQASISSKLDELVTNDEFMSKVDGMSDEVYDFFVNGRDQRQVVEAQPVVSDLVNALAEVDPEFANLREDLVDWKGLELEPMTDGPNFKSIKSGITALAGVSLLLTILTGTLYVRWSQSRRGALLFFGITIPVLGIIDLIAAGIVRSAVVSSVDETDRFASAAVPIVANSVLSPFRMIGVTWIALGVGSMIAGIIVGRQARVASGAANAHD